MDATAWWLSLLPPPPPPLLLNDALQQVELLLQFDADPNVPGRSGMTALHMSARAGAVDVVKLLLQKGADLSIHSTMYYSTSHLTTDTRQLTLF